MTDDTRDVSPEPHDTSPEPHDTSPEPSLETSRKVDIDRFCIAPQKLLGVGDQV